MGACRRLCALALACAWLGATETASAQPDSTPPECGSRADFDAELRRRLGEHAPTSAVSLAISPGPSGFHLRVQLGSEQRELDDASCPELFRAAIVIAVAMLLHDEEKPPPAAPPPPSPSPAAPPPAHAGARPSFGASVGAGVSVGTLPKPVLALELEGKMRGRVVGLSANVRYLLRAQERDASEQGADLHAFGAGVTGIFRPSPVWEARLGVAAQLLSGRGLGSNSRYQDSVWAAGPTLGLNYAPVRHGPLRAGVGAEGQLNLVRGHFEILNYSRDVTDPPHVVYEVPWLSAAAFVRLGLVW